MNQSSDSAAAGAESRAGAGIPMCWSRPAVPGDVRVFRPVPEGSGREEGLSRDESTVLGSLRAGHSGLHAIAGDTGLSYRTVVASVSALTGMSLAYSPADERDGTAEEWKATCARVAEAAAAARSTKARDLKDRVPGVRFGEIRMALDYLARRGPAQVQRASASRAAAPAQARAEAAAVTERPAASRRRKARGTAPVSAWTRRSFYSLIGRMPSDAATRFALPDLEADAKKVLADMKAYLAEYRPEALEEATEKQQRMVNLLLVELKGRPGMASPYEGERLTRTAASAFIARWMPLRPATPRQISYAKHIESLLGIPIPSADGGYLHGELASYISRHRQAASDEETAAFAEAA